MRHSDLPLKGLWLRCFSMGGTAGEHQLATQLGDLARSLHQESPEAVLELVVTAAIELIPGVEEASLSIVTGRKEVETVAPSSELLRRLDDLQWN